MRNQWKLLLLLRTTTTTRPSLKIPNTKFQVNRNFIHLHNNAFIVSNNNKFIINNRICNYSTQQTVIQEKEEEHPHITVLTDIISKSNSNDEINNGLKSSDVLITHELVFSMLRSLDGNVESAKKFFKFVDENENERLSSKCYNVMLGILGTRKDCVNEFWGLLEVMKRKKGYGISRRTYEKVVESFEKDGLVSDLDKLKELYKRPDDISIRSVASGIANVLRERDWEDLPRLDDISIKSVASGIANVLRERDWEDLPNDVKERILGMNCVWSNELVRMVVEKLDGFPRKMILFIWWLQGSLSFKPDKFLYDGLLRVLASSHNVRQIHPIDPFWRIVEEMQGFGYEMEMNTYFFVMGLFCKRRLIEDAVELYEYKMGSADKPPVQDGIFLLRKAVMWSKELNMQLFSRVVETFTNGGNSLTTSILDMVVKSLISVNRLKECGSILKAMEKGGFVPTSEVYNKIIFHLGSVDRGEAVLMISEMKASGNCPDSKTWTSLIHGQCLAGNAKSASYSFRTMVEEVGVTDAGHAFEEVLKGFCRKRKATDAYNFLSEMVGQHQLRPRHLAYKMLIQSLLVQGGFNEALSLLGLMKGHGFPPFLEPFIDHISKSGTGDDAISFLKAVTDRKFPSTSVVVLMIEAFLKAGRHSEAQNCFSKSPSYIRNHADVLNLFVTHKPEGASPTAVVA